MPVQLSNLHFFKMESMRQTLKEEDEPKSMIEELNLNELRKQATGYGQNPNGQQEAHINMFWKEWLKGKSGGKQSVGESTDPNAWEEWLRNKGILGGVPAKGEGEGAKASNGWTADDDLSDYDEDMWGDGGMKRPGEKDSEEFSTEEAIGDDWENSDDDDDHGGQMMPVPSLF